MGQLVGKIFSGFKNDPAKILMLGLDNAGKTTILNRLRSDQTVTTIPTIGFNIETVNPCKGLTITVWDIGGQDKIRSLWKRYYDNTDGLIYVVDSNDPKRFEETKTELFKVVEAENIDTVPILIFANKQDLPKAETMENIIEVLEMGSIANKWHMQACCATRGDGIIDGLQMFSGMLKEYKKGK